MNDVVLQIERNISGVINTGGNVIFESTVFSEGNINYNSITGIITINETGRYIINWWVSTQASISQTGAIFALSTSQGDLLRGNSPIKTGQVNGIAIIDVVAAPITLSLINNSGDNFYYSTSTPVKASLLITKDSITSSFGALLSTEGIVELSSTPTTLILDEQSLASSNLDYSTPNSIVIVNSGVYRIDISVIGVSLITQAVTVALAINSIASNDIIQSIEATAATTVTFALTNFISLSAGDELTLQMDATNDSIFSLVPFGTGVVLSVQRIN